MKTPFHLEGKKILVTGATSGIGQQVCVSIDQMGGQVIATGRNEERLKQTKELLTTTSGHSAHLADLLVEEELKELISKVNEIDGMVHCAGKTAVLPFNYTKKSVFLEMQELNINMPVMTLQALINSKKLNKNSSIIFLSSLASLIPTPGLTAYASSKAALNGLTKSLAKDLVNKKIRVNSILPGMIKTPLMDKLPVTEEQLKKHEAIYPLGFGTPEDVANAVIYLLSDASKWITGSNLVMDGGSLLG